MAIAPKGVDVRQTSTAIVFRAFLQTSGGAKETSGPANLALYELQSDGSLKSYDFFDNTFKVSMLTTPTAAMTHQKGNNGTVNTGVWTYALATLTGFAVGGMYFAQVNDALASPTDQTREFQFGSAEGDLTVDSHNNLNANAHDTGGNSIAAGAIPAAAAGAAGGAAIVGSAMTLAPNQHVIVDSGTVTTLTNLPATPAGWLTAAGIEDGALDGKGDWLLAGSYVAPDNADIAEIAAKLPANAIADESLLMAAINAMFTAIGTPMQAGPVTVGDYANGQDPWTLWKQATPANDATAGTNEWRMHWLTADQYTDETTDTSQWHTVYVIAGTGAPGTGVTLGVKKLFDTVGARVVSSDQTIGQASQ